MKHEFNKIVNLTISCIMILFLGFNVVLSQKIIKNSRKNTPLFNDYQANLSRTFYNNQFNSNLLIDNKIELNSNPSSPDCDTITYSKGILNFDLMVGDDYEWEMSPSSLSYSYDMVITFSLQYRDGNWENSFSQVTLHVESAGRRVEASSQIDIKYNLNLYNNNPVARIVISSINVTPSPGNNNIWPYLKLFVYLDIKEIKHLKNLTLISPPPYEYDPLNIMSPSLSANNHRVHFQWFSFCGNNNYQIQILRLKNKDSLKSTGTFNIHTNIDWDKALTYETGSSDNSIDLTITEGTGWYLWRVRPISNLYNNPYTSSFGSDNGLSDDRNWGNWCYRFDNGCLCWRSDMNLINSVLNRENDSQPLCPDDTFPCASFYYIQFDEDINWKYQRNFSEGDTRTSIFEVMQYADDLLNIRQTQKVFDSQRMKLVQESKLDYSGRPVVQTLPAPYPVTTDFSLLPNPTYNNKFTLGYISDFSQKTVNIPFLQPEFDDPSPSLLTINSPHTMQGSVGDYYSIFQYVTKPLDGNAGAPQSGGYPYSRVIYTQDGTNRVKEQSGYGGDFRIGAIKDGLTRTIRDYYSSVSEEEIVSIFGDEAPASGDLKKITTVDQNKVASISYVNSLGQTIATCVDSIQYTCNQEKTLLHLDGDPGINKDVIENFDTSFKYTNGMENGFISKKFLTVLAGGSYTVNFDFVQPHVVIDNACIQLCTDCDYTVSFRVHNLDNNSIINIEPQEIHYYPDRYNGTPPSSCEDKTNTMQPVQIPISEPGSYVIERIITYDNNFSEPGSNETYKDKFINQVKRDLHSLIDDEKKPLLDELDLVYNGTESLHTFYQNLINDGWHYVTIPPPNDKPEVKQYTKIYNCCGQIIIPDLEKPPCTIDDYEKYLTATTGRSTIISNYVLDYLSKGYTILFSFNYSNINDYIYFYGKKESNDITGKINKLIDNMRLDNRYKDKLCDCWTSIIDVIEYKLFKVDDKSLTVDINKDYNLIDDFLNCTGSCFEGFSDSPDNYISNAHRFFKYTDQCIDCEKIYGNCAADDNNNWCKNKDYGLSNLFKSSCDISNLIDPNTGMPIRPTNKYFFEDFYQCIKGNYRKDSLLKETVHKLVNYQSNGISDQPGYGTNKCADTFFLWVEAKKVANQLGSLDQDEYKRKLNELVDCMNEECRLSTCDALTLSYQNDIINYLHHHGYSVQGEPNCNVNKLNVNGSGERTDFRWGPPADTNKVDINDPNLHDYCLSSIIALAKSMTADCGNDICQFYLEEGHAINCLDETEYFIKNGHGDPQEINNLIKKYLHDIPEFNFSTVGSSCGLGYKSNNMESIITLMNNSLRDRLKYLKNYYDSPGSKDKNIIVDNCNYIRDLIYRTLDVAHMNCSLNWNCATVDQLFGCDPQDNSLIIQDSCNTSSHYHNNWNNTVDFTCNNFHFWDNSDQNSHLVDFYRFFYNPDSCAIFLGRYCAQEQYIYTFNYYSLISAFKVYEFCDACCPGDLNLCYKLTDPPLIVIDTIIKPSADQVSVDEIIRRLNLQFQDCFNSQEEYAENSYNAKCHNYDELKQHTTIKVHINQQHYTLYYYDRAGNLVRTISPKGVDIKSDRKRNEDVTVSGQPVIKAHPEHTFETYYQYNSLHQLVKTKSPDNASFDETADVTTDFYYDPFGRLRFSQDARQKQSGIYSYTKYDNLSRIIESGEFLPAPGDIIPQKASSTDINDKYYPDKELIKMKVNNYYSLTYPIEAIPVPPNLPPPYNTNSTQQTFLQNRISYSVRSNNYSMNPDTDKYKSTTIYSYDPHGNVTWVIQSVPLAIASTTTNDFIVSKIDYEYDLISGKVKSIVYNNGRADEYHYKYNYDEDNRLKKVMTSRTGAIWDRDAEYTYYPHGPLRRIDLGEDKIQGIDYFYTINGWLKGINTLTFNNSLGNHIDIGVDGTSSGIHSNIPKDAFGMQLKYYNDDYTPIGTSSSEAISTLLFKPLYNGNIAGWQIANNPVAVNQLNLVSTVKNAEADIFRYDILNRLKSSDYLSKGPAAWGIPGLQYHTDYSYDPNGNITNLTRNKGGIIPPFTIDNLTLNPTTYNYSGGITAKTNRLNNVDDAIPNSVLNDLADQNPDNYNYDNSGNLIQDNQEGIVSIAWTADGKVSSILKNENIPLPCNPNTIYLVGGSTTYFYYDAQGRRVAKYRYTPEIDLQIEQLTTCGYNTDEVKCSLLDKYGSKGTYYVREANGEIITIYEGNQSLATRFFCLTLQLKERLIYGSETHGNFAGNTEHIDYNPNFVPVVTTDRRILGQKYYDIKDHLGNVRLTLNDYKLRQSTSPASLFDVSASSLTNYYPFGMEQQDRSAASGTARFGYNGMLKDNDLKGEGNSYTTEFRGMDPRIGRWWSLDPKSKAWESGYVSMGNNPILNVDTKGDDWFVNDQGFYFWSDKTSVKGFEYAGNVLPDNTSKYKILEMKDGQYYHKYMTNPIINSLNKIFGTNFIINKPYDPSEESFNEELLTNSAGYLGGYAIGKLGSLLWKSLSASGGSVWKMASTVERGEVIEKILGKNLSSNNPIIDKWLDGTATSIKSIDLKCQTYQKMNQLTSILERYIDKVANFKGQDWAGLKIPENAIKKRVLELAIPPNPSSEQVRVLQQMQKYSIENNVNLIISVFK